MDVKQSHPLILHNRCAIVWNSYQRYVVNSHVETDICFVGSFPSFSFVLSFLTSCDGVWLSTSAPFQYYFEAEGSLYFISKRRQTCWGNSPDVRVESTSWKQLPAWKPLLCEDGQISLFGKSILGVGTMKQPPSKQSYTI